MTHEKGLRQNANAGVHPLHAGAEAWVRHERRLARWSSRRLAARGYCGSNFVLVGLTEALRTELHGEPVHVALVLPGVVETPMVDFLELWSNWLNMPPSWVVWAVFAAARFQLVEVSVPPGAAALEKLAALAPGVADNVVHWAKRFSHWLSTGSQG